MQNIFIRIAIAKPDLDTCLTALLLRVNKGIPLIIRGGGATPEELNDPSICCIEAGGSGQVHLNNFDHHDPALTLPPACEQAFETICAGAEIVEKYVRYVSEVDLAKGPHVEFPSVSSLFSGMLLCTLEPEQQFWKGIELLKQLIDLGCDPYSPVPERDEWRPFIEAKELNRTQADTIFEQAEFFTTAGGLNCGLIEMSKEQKAFGLMGKLYAAGCDIGILYSMAFGNPPVPKYTIGSETIRLTPMLELLNSIEEGWGGQQMIIGSPRTESGSRISPDKIRELVIRHL